MNAFRNLPDSILCGPEHASGVILGTLRGRKIVDTSMAPSVVLGPCASGKGASVLTPSLLTWRGSAVVVEPAGELRDLTAAWRRNQAANRILHLRFDGWESSDTFNLLDGIRRDTKVWECCTTKVILPLNSLLEAELAIAGLYSRHYKRRRLSPDLLMRLGRRCALLRRHEHPPIRISATRYYEDVAFREAAGMKATANATQPEGR